MDWLKSLTDEDIVRQYQLGSKDSFEELLRRYGSRIYTYLRRLVRDPMLAEDLYQDVFLKFIKGLPEFKFQGKVRNWLFSVAHSTAIDRLKRDTVRRTTSLEREIRNEEEQQTQELKDVLPSEAPLPEDEFAERELYARLAAAEDELPPLLKEVYLLRKHSELTFKEIAILLNCPEGTALSRMHLAVKFIRTKLELKVNGDSTHELP